MADRSIKISVDIVQGAGGTQKIKGTLNEIDNEVKRINKSAADSHKQTNKVIVESDKMRAKAELDIEKSLLTSKKNYLKSLESASKDTARRMKSIFADVFAGSFLGTSAASAASAGLSKSFSMLQTAFSKSLDFSQMKVSLAQFEGSMEAAESRIQKLMKTAQDTPGLSFLSAIDGQKRLMAVGFAGDQATKILQGLSKVRILSGATKQDFDAMIVNLVQIASGGQNVTQEIREMATRMPALIGIIRKEFGTVGKELNDIDPKVFVERLASAASKSRADFNSMGLAVENLQDAFDRLYIAIGSVIEQNPEVLAAIQTLTKEMDGNTDALSKNESQTRTTFGTWITWAAKASISTVNFIQQVSGAATDVASTIAALFFAFGTGLTNSLSFLPKAMNSFVIGPINAVIDLAKRVPWLFGGQAAADLMAPVAPFSETMFGDPKQFARMTNDVWNRTRGYDTAKQNSTTRWARYNEQLDSIRSGSSKTNSSGSFWGQNYTNPSTGGPANVKPGGSLGSSGGRSATGVDAYVNNAQAAAFGRAMAKLSPALKAKIEQAAEYYGIPTALAFAQIFAESGFKTNAQSPMNPGVGPAFGLTQQVVGTASRMLGQNVTGEMLKRNPEMALTAWGKYMSKLFERYGDWELATLAYHQGEGTVDKLAAILDKGRSGDSFFKDRPNGKAYIAKIGGLAGLGGGGRYEKKDSKGDPLGTIEDFKSEVLGTDALQLRDTKGFERQIDLYSDMADAIFLLNERTREEIFLRDVALGKYADLSPEMVEQLRLGHQLLDLDKQRRESAERNAEVQKESADLAREAVEKYRDEQKRVFDDTQYFFENKINSFIDGGFKGLWRSILDDMRQNFVKQFSTLLAPAFTPNFAGVQKQGGAAGGGLGGIFQGIFGGGIGGGMGPGGTPMFNPGNFAPSGGGFNPTTGGGLPTMSQGVLGSLMGNGPSLGGGKSGGLGGILSMFGLKNNVFTGKAMTGNMSATSGIGSLIGMAGGAIGGKWGNMLSMAGTGMSIGAMFGPWGAAIGAAAGGLIGLFSALKGDGAIKKLKAAALSTYGITVKDKEVLNSLKAIGEQYFGKGKAGENALQVVGLDESKNILRNYAAATGQGGDKIDMMSHSDVNWSGNQFKNSNFGGYRVNGGRVYPGLSYVVGERRPEMFTPDSPGHISPSIPNTQGVSNVQMQVILGQLIETIEGWKEQMRAIPKGAMLEMAVQENPRAVYKGLATEYQNDSRSSEQIARLNGTLM